MIPQFPEFKKLELSDEKAITEITETFPPYSDFDFWSLFAWDTRQKTEISLYKNNLIVQFSDYLTGELFFSFIGSYNATETALVLLDYAKQRGIEQALHLIPEDIAVQLETYKFEIEEDRDQFDYIYKLENHIPYLGSGLKNARNAREAFYRRTPGHIPFVLDLNDASQKQDVLSLLSDWHELHPIENEPLALKKFMSNIPQQGVLAVGIRYKEKLIAFAINTILPNNFANCLFAKANVKFYGIYSVLMYENARMLIEQNCRFLNFEQDLGLGNLRLAKTAFDPNYFLKKYTIVLKKWSK